MTEEHGASALTRHVYDQVIAGRRDILERLLHEDFRLSGTREHVGREEWMRIMLDDVEITHIDLHPIKTDEVTDNALISTATVTFVGHQNGEPLHGTWLVIDIWHRDGIDWLLISRTTFPTRPTRLSIDD